MDRTWRSSRRAEPGWEHAGSRRWGYPRGRSGRRPPAGQQFVAAGARCRALGSR